MYIIYCYNLKLNVIDSGSQKMQRTCETPAYVDLDDKSTKEVVRKNSKDSCMGRLIIFDVTLEYR